MQAVSRILLLCSLILGACSLPAPTVTLTPIPPSDTPTAAVEVTPDTRPCGYQWAYQDLPELEESFRESIQALQPEARAHVYAFGENCVYEDGSIGRFGAKETDFEVTLQVDDLSDHTQLGEWIVKVMQVITAIPPEQIVGPQPGLVRITFQAGAEQSGVNFYIDRFQELPAGLSPAEIFEALQTMQ